VGALRRFVWTTISTTAVELRLKTWLNAGGIMSNTKQCPLAEVDKRLSDTHRLWHRTNESYFDPEEFRINLNSLIQTARTVTFILQKNKDKIPRFETWYASHQAAMKADPTMRWLVDARNEIEKEGDLATKSLVRVEIVASHLNEFPVMQVEAHLFDDVNSLFKKVPRYALKEQVLKHGLLQIERKWVHDKLPDTELLEALAHAYGVMSKIVADAHKQIGLPEPFITGLEECAETKHVDGRLPCMNSPGEVRTTRIHLADGSKLSVVKKSIKLDSEGLEDRLKQHYGRLPAQRDEGATPFEKQCYSFFNIGRMMMEKDHYHDSLVFLMKDGRVQPMLTPARDRQEKYMLSRMIADEVQKMGADAVITIGEVWVSAVPFNELKPFQYPSDMKGRKEGLMLTGVTKLGEIFSLTADITRDLSLLRRVIKKPEKTNVGPTVIAKDIAPFFLAPIYEVWGFPAPTQSNAHD
jgi:hypothetical protein